MEVMLGSHPFQSLWQSDLDLGLEMDLDLDLDLPDLPEFSVSYGIII